MSKKLLELAKEKLNNQLLSDFEDFYAFTKSEDMTFSQGYKCHKLKYKGMDISKVRISDNSVGCTILIERSENYDNYVEGQAHELVKLFNKALEHKCINCEEHGCSVNLALTIHVAGNSHKNICVNAFGDHMSFSFLSIDNDMKNMMWITPWVRPTSLRHRNDFPVSIDSVKNLIRIRKTHIMNKMEI